VGIARRHGLTASTGDATRVEVVPATAERWDDIAAILGGDGERGCWCQYWRLSAGDYSRTRGADRPNQLRRLTSGDPAPGMLAYVDGEPAGWLGLGPRPALERLVRSRTIPAVDDVPVWSIVCFMIRVGFRRRGVARALLAGAVAYARSSGAPGLEAYPIDPGDRRADTAFGYVGFTRMFEAEGFRRVTETAARSDGRPRVLMRLDLAG
jgi:GNAT superfamily N-acetyltransferase